MKALYGLNNCFLLRMNSRPPGKVEQLPDPWSRYVQNKRIEIAAQESSSNSALDVSPSTIKLFLDSPESNKQISDKRGNNLAYHPLSPDHTFV